MELPDEIMKEFGAAIYSRDVDHLERCTSRLIGEVWKKYPQELQVVGPETPAGGGIPFGEVVGIVDIDPGAFVIKRLRFREGGGSQEASTRASCPHCANTFAIHVRV